MANIVESIKILRDRTEAGIMNCKEALQKASGDIDLAEEILRKEGIAKASKKSSRDTEQGIVGSYIHAGGKIGAIVEVNCETDFVARTEGFKELVHNLSMQVAAMSPLYVDESDAKFDDSQDPEQVCLIKQSFIKDPSKNIETLVNESVGKLGENIRIRRFSRFALGE